MKKVVRLTENDLRRIVKNSVNKVLNENYEEEGLGNRFKNAFYGFQTGNYDMQDMDRSNTVSRMDSVKTIAHILQQALMNLEGSYGNQVNINRGISKVKEAIQRLGTIRM